MRAEPILYDVPGLFISKSVPSAIKHVEHLIKTCPAPYLTQWSWHEEVLTTPREMPLDCEVSLLPSSQFLHGLI